MIQTIQTNQTVRFRLRTGADMEGTVVQTYNDELQIRGADKGLYWRKQSSVTLLLDRQLALVGPGSSIQTGLVVQPTQSTITIRAPFYSAEEKFDFVVKVVRMVVQEVSPSCLITGSGGIGKSFEVMAELMRHGLKEGDDFYVVKGYITAAALFQVFEDQNGKILIFDDTDDVMKDPTSLNLLKAALDSYEKRVVSWITAIETKQIQFEGKVIFISNLPEEKVPQPLRSRTVTIDLTLTPGEKIGRMRTILANLGTNINVTSTERSECLELIEEYKDIARDLNIRTLLKVMKIRAAHQHEEDQESWKRLAVYTMVNNNNE